MRNVWIYRDCPKHGSQPHLSILDYKCCECAVEESKERIEKYHKDKRRRELSYKNCGAVA